jgi:hypothetical protein
MNGMK